MTTTDSRTGEERKAEHSSGGVPGGEAERPTQIPPKGWVQVVKRGWTDAGIPSALLPGVKPIWGVVILLAVAATLVLLREAKSHIATTAAARAAAL